MKQTVIKYSPENKEISLERKRDEEKEKGKRKRKNRFGKPITVNSGVLGTQVGCRKSHCEGRNQFSPTLSCPFQHFWPA